MMFLFQFVPGGFVPEEDQGYFLVNIQLPDAASLQRADDVAKKVEQIMMETPGIELVTTITGYSLLTGSASSNSAFLFTWLLVHDQIKVKSRMLPNVGDYISALLTAVFFGFMVII